MLKTSYIPSLVDLVVELASHALLFGKIIKEESITGISSSELENLKKELAKLGKNLKLALEANSSLTTKVKELSNVNAQYKDEKEPLKDEIVGLTGESLKLHGENQQLKEGLFDLSFAKQADAEHIHHLQLEISQLKLNESEAKDYVIEQHKLGFDKAFQQAKYF